MSKTVTVIRLLAAALLAVPLYAHAVGLGNLTVLSALGQPLDAEVQIVALQPGEAESLKASLASPAAFTSAGIQLNPALLKVKFVIEHRGDHLVLHLSSAQPINDPFLDALIELQWSSDPLGLLWASLNAALFVGYVVLGHTIAKRGAGVERLGAAMAVALGEGGGRSPAAQLLHDRCGILTVAADVRNVEDGHLGLRRVTAICDDACGCRVPSNRMSAHTSLEVRRQNETDPSLGPRRRLGRHADRGAHLSAHLPARVAGGGQPADQAGGMRDPR